jgi:hypothetical protein
MIYESLQARCVKPIQRDKLTAYYACGVYVTRLQVVKRIVDEAYHVTAALIYKALWEDEKQDKSNYYEDGSTALNEYKH